MQWKDENAHLAKAEQIQQSRPQWMVVFGIYSRLYWAFPLFDMTPRIIPHSADPDHLIELMDRVETKFRIWPKGGSTQ